MNDTVRTIKDAIRRLRKLERYNKLKLSEETIRELDAWIRHLIYSDELTAAERRRLQDFYLQTL